MLSLIERGARIVGRYPVSSRNTTLDALHAGRTGSYHQRWRPFTLRKRALSTIVVLTLCLAALLVLLQRIDYNNGALIYADDRNEFSKSQIFAFRYLPIILVTLYATFITAIDLDVKRLEPWYRLSGNDACSGAESLNLEYDVDFVLSVIIKSFSSR